jgi:LPS O-antigen subunit length determinant protein (WzzB/FepE family)
MNNEHLLSQKISTLLFKSPSHATIVSITGLVAGLVGGFAALAGSYLRSSKIVEN